MSRKPAYHPLRGKAPKPVAVVLAAIAERTGVTPEVVQKWVTIDGFPAPTRSGDELVWLWKSVHRWLKATNRMPTFRRWVYVGHDQIREESLNADDRWEPLVVFIGSDFDGWTAYPQPALVELSKEPQLSADGHLRAWCDARVRWVAEHPDEPMPRHLAGIPLAQLAD